MLARALKRLAAGTATPLAKASTTLKAALRPGAPAHLRLYLQRLQLDRPSGAGEWLLRKLVVNALIASA